MSLTQYRKREEEEEGGPKWGRGNFLWPDAIGDHPAFYARDAALGWRLCHSRLEGAFSHKGANRKNVSSPRLHSSEKWMRPAFSMGGGAPIGGVSGLVPYNVTMGRLYTTGPSILFTRGTPTPFYVQRAASVDCNTY